jgi:GTP-binding protein HflX
VLDIHHTLQFLPIHVINPRANKERSVSVGEELESLIATLGGEIVERVIQKLDNPNNATFIGRGKVQEVIEILRKKSVDVVVLNSMAKPRQIMALKKEFQMVSPNIDVWDRVDLILHIFDKHAVTTEAKLQIELARMQYMGPRIYGMGFVLSQQGGGIGTSGIGETNTELMKRHWRNEIKKVTDKLDKVSKTKEQQLNQRTRSGIKTISIVGYTNAGKSALFNTLTGKNTLVENALFATLDSTSGKMYLHNIKQEVLVTDTIGFIRNLPPRLIKAFTSTLMEAAHADILLHVIDVSDPEYWEKITTVNGILHDLGINPDDAIYIFNKIDLVPDIHKENILQKYADHNPLFISVKTGEGIGKIQEAIENRLQAS